MPSITTLSDLEAIYGVPADAATIKEVDHLTPAYRRYIDAAPFLALATIGPDGMDCSPRGDRGSVVAIADDKTLILPDRRGNNRLDSLRNIVSDPRVSLMFLVPGADTVMRVNGRAAITADADKCAQHAVDGHLPRTLIIITIDRVYFQCARAVMRADLWNPTTIAAMPPDLPKPGEMLAEISNGTVGGKAYDDAWPARAAKSMW